MALLGIYHRTIHTLQRSQNKAFLLRKPLPADPESFGERFRATRVDHGYTQTEMARKFGVSLSTVKFWEQGRTHPNPPVRAQVEAFLTFDWQIQNQPNIALSGLRCWEFAASAMMVMRIFAAEISQIFM